MGTKGTSGKNRRQIERPRGFASEQPETSGDDRLEEFKLSCDTTFPDCAAERGVPNKGSLLYTHQRAGSGSAFDHGI